MDIEVRSILVPNTIVTGGTSLIPGLIDRMRIEINRQNRELLAHLKMNGSELGIRGLIDPLNSVWHGGSKLASNSLFQQYFTVEKKEYLSERDGVMDPESKFYNKDIYWAKVMDQVTIS